MAAAMKDNNAAFPVISLFVALALLITGIHNGYPDWIALVIIAAWFVGCHFWYKRQGW